MKRTTLISLILLLLLTLTLMASCDREKTPEETTPEITETAPETQAETTLADIPAADALDQLMSAPESESGETETMDNGKIDIDMTMDMMVSVDGVQNTTTLPIKITVVMDGDNFHLDGNLFGSASTMTYTNGMLYLTAFLDVETVSKLKCAMTPEEFALVAPIIFGTDTDIEGGDLTVPELPAMEGTKPSDLYTTVTSKLDETNGDLIITCKGFNTALASDLAPLLQPMLEGLGLVGGGEWDENGELITDPAATLAEVVGILRGLNEETMEMTFTFDKNGVLLSTAMDITLSIEEEGSTITMRMKGSFAIKEGGQTVTAPADADSYTEEHWRVIFDMETAEMLELIPDAEGCITLSSNKDRRERQILYIYNHYEEFAGVLFHLGGYVVDSYVVDEETATIPAHVGAFEGMISLCDPAAEEEDYATAITFQIPLSAKGEGYPAEGSFIKVQYAKLELVEDSLWGSYVYLVVTDYR